MAYSGRKITWKFGKMHQLSHELALLGIWCGMPITYLELATTVRASWIAMASRTTDGGSSTTPFIESQRWNYPRP